jgi:signal transduction histidine kinase
MYDKSIKTVEDLVSEEISETKRTFERLEQEPLQVDKLTPKYATKDLKTRIQYKLDQLETQTQEAIIKMVRSRLLE